MLDALKALWKPSEALLRMQDVLSCVNDLLEHFEEAKLKDGNSRDAAIDVIIQILQSQKSK